MLFVHVPSYSMTDTLRMILLITIGSASIHIAGNFQGRKLSQILRFESHASSKLKSSQQNLGACCTHL